MPLGNRNRLVVHGDGSVVMLGVALHGCMRGDEFAQRPVDRRRAVESDVRTQVVCAGPALIAATAWLARFDGDTFAYSRWRHSFADFDNLTGRFVSQDQRTADHEIANAAVLVVVDIRSANSY